MNKRKVLITGTSSGVGLALIKLLEHRDDLEVYGLGRRRVYNVNMTDQFIADLSNIDSTKTALHCNFRTTNYDVIVQNAGATLREYLMDHSDSDVVELMNINLMSPILIHKHLDVIDKPQLFINVLSGSAVEDFRKLPIYGTAKAGLLKFMHQMIKDYKDMTAQGHNVGIKKIINLLPGPIDTKLCPDHYRTGSVPLLTPEEVAQNIVNRIDRTEFSSDHSILDIKI